MFPVKPKIKSKDKRYDLVYRGEVLTKNAPYGLCIFQINEMVREGTHTKRLFTIKLTK